jgi:hypothetical protein
MTSRGASCIQPPAAVCRNRCRRQFHRREHDDRAFLAILSHAEGCCAKAANRAAILVEHGRFDADDVNRRSKGGGRLRRLLGQRLDDTRGGHQRSDSGAHEVPRATRHDLESSLFAKRDSTF